MTSRRRMSVDARREDIVAAALRLSCEHGYANVTKGQIAEAAGCSQPLVTFYFGTVVAMRRSIMRAAVAEKCLPVIAQGLSLHDQYALKANDDLRKAAADSLCQ